MTAAWVKAEIERPVGPNWPPGHLIRLPVICRDCNEMGSNGPGLLAIRRVTQPSWSGACVCLRHATAYLGRPA